MKSIYLAFFILITAGTTLAQTLVPGFPVVEEAVRRNQLLSSFDSTVSFTFKPLYAEAYADSAGYLKGDSSSLRLWKELVSFGNGAGSVRLLPLQLRADYNSHRPYGWNNGAMIPAAGLQTLFSAGIFAKAGPLEVQLRPEVVYAGNKEFDGFVKPHVGVIVQRRYSYSWNRIDAPERFGEEAYKQLLPGQSSVRLNYKGLSIGASTENIWWGPGRYNSLLMTNNARGFEHLTFNTTRPLQTGIGSFEFQLMAGRLESSGFYPPDTAFVFNGNRVYSPKNEDWRYLNGFMATYQPKWLKGLTLGGARVVQEYHEAVWERKDFLPVFGSIFRLGDNFFDDSLDRDHMLSIFARWVWEEAKSEIYTEFGRNDASWNLRDLIMSPQHSRAYVFGITKMLPLEWKESHVELNTEFTHLEKSGSFIVRAEPPWYAHGKIGQGYTHKGEVVGAGIGPGSNAQYAGLHWVKNLNRLGVFFERVVNDNDFYYQAFQDSRDFRRYWVDVSLGVTADYRRGNFLLSGKLQAVRALNYQWELTQLPDEPYFVNGRDVSNLYLSFNTAYLF